MPSLKQRAPHTLKVLGRRMSIGVGQRTSALRLPPSFILAGGQRCGTTSLFRALLDHPAILGPVHHKGVNYFDVNYERGWDWYQGHFPIRSLARLRTRGTGQAPATFDASGYYLYHPHAPQRLARDMPEAKVLVMLRDPVDRAFSAYKHEYARGFETETFERALALEDERVEPELERMRVDPHHYSSSHRHHSYRRRGQYAEQIARFTAELGAERVLIIESTDFFQQPEREYPRIIDFLGLSPHTPARFETWNARPGSPLSTQEHGRLADRFADHDEALVAMMGHRPSWRP